MTLKSPSRILAALVAALALGPAAVQAAAPDAGQLLREQQPQRQLPRPLPAVEGEAERPPLSDTGVRVTVVGFRFSGHQGLATEAELQAVVAGAVGRSLGFAELQQLAEQVTAHLRAQGWFLARAYLPKQDVTEGWVEIAILQGKSDGSLSIIRDKSVRIGEETLRAIGASAVRPGQPLHGQALERAVLLMNDLPGVSARASLAAGGSPGTTGVQVAVSEGPLLSGAAWGDNQGNRYTGAWRGSGLISLNDPLHYGDRLSLMLTGGEGLLQGRAEYAMPLTASGLRGSLAYTGMVYELGKELEAQDLDGWGHTVNAGLSYPLLRSRTTNVRATLGYEFKALVDRAVDLDIRDRTLHSGTAGLSGDHYDRWFGGGYTSWSGGVTTGALDEAVANIGLTQTQGAYTRVNLSLTRLQRIVDRLALNLSWGAQLTLDNLDSSEKFYLGGPSGIRAYPVGEAPGDEGHLINVDLLYDLPLPPEWGAVQLNGFYDAGHITLHKQLWPNAVATATNQNRYWLQGAGLGLSYSYAGWFSLKLAWAHVIGDNPGRSAAGLDADGRSDEQRVWLRASIYF